MHRPAYGQFHHIKIFKNYYQNSIDHMDPLKRFPDDTLKDPALKDHWISLMNTIYIVVIFYTDIIKITIHLYWADGCE